VNDALAESSVVTIAARIALRPSGSWASGTANVDCGCAEANSSKAAC
jgi:hypothetical protein